MRDMPDAVCGAPIETGRPMQSARNEEAEIKSFTLLKEEIGEEKFIKLVALDYVEVGGKYGKYQIYRQGDIALHKTDTIGRKTRPIIWKLCAMFPDSRRLPTGDKLLGLILSIKNDEDKFIESVNFRFIETIDEYNEQHQE